MSDPLVLTAPDWRPGLAILARRLGTGWLVALRDGLAAGDPALRQARTTWPDYDPPPGCPDEALEGGCAIVYGLWRSGQVSTLRQAWRAFREAVGASRHWSFDCAVRGFIDWFDNATPQQLAGELIEAIDRLLAGDRAGSP